jgi:uncharacterized protein (DUF58 family)
MFMLPALQQRMDGWIARRNPARGHEIHLHHRRLYILPTRFGYLYVMMLIMLLLAAINYSNSMAYVLTFLLTSIGIISLWQTHKNLLGLDVRMNTPTPVHAHQEVHIEFILSHATRATRYAIGMQYRKRNPEYVTLPPEQSKTLTLAVPAARRGQFKPAGIVIFTRYPTGLFHAWSWLKFDVPIVVYPQADFSHKAVESLVAEAQSLSTVDTADGDDFAGLREYQPGESLKHISWKAYAQGRGMLTKTFQGHASPSLWIDFADMPAPTLEGRLAQMTAQVIECSRQGRSYGIRLPGDEVAQSSGAAHKARCLKQIALFKQSDFNAELALDE